MNNEIINVNDVIQSSLAVSSDQGNKLFKKLSHNLNDKVISTVYFDNVNVLTTAFLNTGIGNLYRIATKDVLNKYIVLKSRGLSKSKFDKIRLVMENANNRLSDEDTDREIFDDD